MGLLSIGGKAVSIGATPVNFDLQDPQIYVTPTTISSIPYEGGTYCVSVCGAQWNKVTVVDACTWITPSASQVTPTASPGTTTCITISSNPAGGAARSGVVCYIPQSGCATRQVTVCQLCSPITNINVDISLTWDATCGGTNGFGGRYWVKCCDGSCYSCRTLLDYTENDSIQCSLPAGCYYVDFECLNARINGQLVSWDFCWLTNTGNGSTCITSCFGSSNNYASGSLPLGCIPPV